QRLAHFPSSALALSFICLSIAGCVFPGVYKLDVQQGNIVTQDMLDKLKPGMTERQVVYVMGNPVLQNPYNNKQWEYRYSLEERDVVTHTYHIRVFFDDAQRYTHYEGDLPEKSFKEKDQLKTLPTEEKSANTVPTDF